MYNADVSWSVPGLRNLGNTCYIASALQALASSPAFLRYLTDATIDITPAALPLTCVLRDLIVRLQPQPGNLPALDPWPLFAALRGKIPDHLLAPGEQHDAVEALELLVDTVSNELKRHYKQESLASPFQDVLAPSDSRHLEEATSSLLVWKTQAASPLHGFTTHETMCTACGHCFTTQTTAFQSLVLPLSKDATSHLVARGLSLQTCLFRTCSGIELVEGVVCANCSLKATLRAAADAPVETATASGTEHLLSSHPCSCSSADASEDESPAAEVRDMAASTRIASLEGTWKDSLGAAAAAVACWETRFRKQPGQAVAGAVEDAAPVSERTLSDASNCSDAATASGRLQRIEACYAPADLPGSLPDAEDLEALASSAGLQWVVQRTRVARTAPISRPPKVLALHLKRGVYTGSGQLLKLRGCVPFTERLDLLPFTSAAPNSSILLPRAAGKQHAFKPAVERGEGPAIQAAGSEPLPCLYSLAAVIVHSGHSNSGHYHVYRRIWDKQMEARLGNSTESRAVTTEVGGSTNTPSFWLSVSDQSSRPADLLEVLACEATLLLYEKQELCV